MIELRDICVQAGTFRLENMNLTIPAGQYGFLLGRTGSGKTTLLEAICGLRPVRSGRILIDGRDVTGLRPADRGIGFVPQDGALFPTMTVAEHLGFALWVRHWPRARIAARVQELAASLGLTDLLPRHPAGLSGGEKQRVGLGRALSFGPRVLCLDEPLSALDPETRRDIMGLLQRINAETGLTALHITHNLEEPGILGHLVYQIREGRLVIREDLGAPARSPSAPDRSPPAPLP